MLDTFGRHHHDQLHRNSNTTSQGTYLDTLEIIFNKPIPAGDKERVREIIDAFSEKKVGRIAWPLDIRCTLTVPAGYYRVAELQRSLSKSGFNVNGINHFYSARLYQK